MVQAKALHPEDQLESTRSVFTLSQFPLTYILNAACLGLTVPLLYFTTSIERPCWIGLAIVVASVGWMLGRINAVDRRRALMIAALGYGLIAIGGAARFEFYPTVALIEIGIMLVSFGSVNVQSTQPHDQNRWIMGTAGFCTGCGLAAMISHHVLSTNILVTFHLTYAGLLAMAVCAISGILTRPASAFPPREKIGNPFDRSAFVRFVRVSTAATLGMMVCIIPLMERETFAFSPARLGLFFSMVIVISVYMSRLHIPRILAAQSGLLLIAVASVVFTLAWSITWLHACGGHPLDGQRVGSWMLWPAGGIAAAGYGLVRIELMQSRSSTPVTAIIMAVSAMAVVSIWMPHERTTLALPALIAITGLSATAIKKAY